jgi:hypothetical protein
LLLNIQVYTKYLNFENKNKITKLGKYMKYDDAFQTYINSFKYCSVLARK